MPTMLELFISAFVPLFLIIDPANVATLAAEGITLRTGWIAVTAALFAAMAVTWIVLRASGVVKAVLGVTGMTALTRIMGFLLVCIAAQMMVSGALGVAKDVQAELQQRTTNVA